MAYAPSTFPPVLMSQPMANVPALFNYSPGSATVDSDSIGTINGSGYFSDGLSRGMKVGDTVLVTTWTGAPTGSPTGHICLVTSASGTAVTTTLVSGTT